MSELMEAKQSKFGRCWLALGLFFCFIAGAWCQSQGFFEFGLENPDEIWRLTVQHIQLVVTAAIIAVILGVPIGVLVTRGFMHKYRELTLNALGICQTVPSLAIIAIAMGFMGIGMTTAIFGLVVYSIIPIIRNPAA